MVKLLSEDVIRHALDTGWLSCEDLHDHGCLQAAFLRFLLISSKIYKYYIPFHLIPFLLFKLKRLKKQPAKTVLMALLHYVKSIVFMAGYNTILKWWLCKNTHIFGKMTSTGPSFGAFLSAWSCFLEPEGRRTEICLFILPRFLETLWNYLIHRKLAKPIWGGENLLFGVAMGTIVYYYSKMDKAIKPSYNGVLKRFMGVN